MAARESFRAGSEERNLYRVKRPVYFPGICQTQSPRVASTPGLVPFVRATSPPLSVPFQPTP
jgi:hypothetical protein